MRKIWPFSLSFLMFAGYATVGPFFVLFYQSLGFSGTQIGALTGIAPLLTFLIVPLWTRFADRTHRHRLLMSVALAGSIVVLSLFPLLRAFAPILGLAVLLNVFLAPVTPFADNAAMFMLGEKKHLYGRIRLGGTIGYGVAASLAGVLVHRFGLTSAFWGCSSMFLLAFLVSLKLVHAEPNANVHPGSKGSLRAFFATPRWPLFLAVAFAGGLSLSSFNYLFPFMAELGASESLMGLALTIGTIAEIPVLFLSHRLIERFRPYPVLMLAMGAMGIRLLLFAVSRTPGHVLLTQILNGITFPLAWVAGVAYANGMAPAGLTTTAQGIFSATVYGFGMAVGGFLGGLLLERLGGRGLYIVFGIIVLAIVALVALIQSRLPTERPTSHDIAMP